MTVLYIDTEHDRMLAHPEFGPAHRVKVEATQSRLAAAAGMPCLSLRFPEITPAQVARVGPAALVISGSTTDWAEYDFSSLAGLLATIRAALVPILGICAGHQLIGFAHGAPWGPLDPLQAGEADPDPRFAPGRRKERGFLPVEVDPHCPLFQGLDSTAAFFQSHYWQLEGVPRGFTARARSPWSPVQAIERLDRPVFGVQFHPERYSAAQPDGATVLRNFFALAPTDRIFECGHGPRPRR
jgi:GMP synthase-like glutamine amidotransferase